MKHLAKRYRKGNKRDELHQERWRGWPWTENSGIPWSMAYAPSEQTGISKVYNHSLHTEHIKSRENVHTNMTAMSIRVFSVKFWNSLITSLVSITSKYIFKCHYVNILLSKYIM